MNKIVTYNALGRYGRLCNGMFQAASTIGIARKNGFDFAFPYWMNHDHKDRFGSTEDIDVQKHFVNPLPLYDGPPLPERFIDWGYHDIVLTESVSLAGHMQSAKYFEHCLDEVRGYFRMKDEPPQNEYVAIHVRLQDYDDQYHPRLDMRYYGPAMAQFPPGTYFKVFSDDLRAALSMLGCDGFLHDGKGSYIDDFREMKRCKSFIIGNSSYSAMAAILGEHPEKRVVAPRPWFGKKYTAIDGEDIYDKDWSIINWQ